MAGRVRAQSVVFLGFRVFLHVRTPSLLLWFSCFRSLPVALSLWAATSVQDADRNGADLSGLSYAEAVEYLREQATILDYKTLGRKAQDALNAASPGIVPGVSYSLPSLQP